MSGGFGTSLRRNPDDPRRLWERIEAQVLERIEEAVDAACLEALVRLHREGGRPIPAPDSPADRAEFEALVDAFLRHLRASIATDLSSEQMAEVAGVESQAPAEGHARLLAVQVALAKLLPDYWSRFEAARNGFAAEASEVSAERGGWLGRLLGRRQP